MQALIKEPCVNSWVQTDTGGALIVYAIALTPGGAAIREGAANRDNTVIMNLIGENYHLWRLQSFSES